VRRISTKVKQITAAVSVSAALVMVYMLYILQTSLVLTYTNEVLMAAILIAITPSAILDWEHSRWINTIEDQMPTFVRGISESQETGLTLFGAFNHVVNSGIVKKPLATEIEKITIMMSWGSTFEDALTAFKDRIASPVVSRFCVLVLEASRSGGEIRKVFTATSGFMEEMREADREANANMRSYIIIVYVAFAVFLWIGIILLESFFKPLESSRQVLSSLSTVGLREFNDFFYKTMIVSGLMGGLMAGKIGERRLAGGLKHSIVMVIAGYLIFYLFAPPNWVGA
jgi:flagellar protein FlaJ